LPPFFAAFFFGAAFFFPPFFAVFLAAICLRPPVGRWPPRA
jgi:hypothetical protein